MATAHPRTLLDDPTQTPLSFGVGARITAAVMTEDYAQVLTGALAGLDETGLVRETGDVSTYLGGAEQDLLRYVTDLGEALARTEHHATLTLQLSRGCPGEVVCELPGGAGPRRTETPSGRRTGRFATAEWALYPLADQVAADGTAPDHMRDIYAAIDHAREGDLGDVLATAVAGWVLVGRSVQHVTSHVSISLNSPSHEVRALDGARA